MRVLVAMSGGVDSSVAAALLKQQGYDVIGATMQLWFDPEAEEEAAQKGKGCCSLEAISDARLVCSILNIPHYVLNFKDYFIEKVVDYFMQEYLQGRTPNPCIACNRYVKFVQFLQKAEALKCDYIATGHYVRRVKDPTMGVFLLKKGKDRQKDQSYMLYCITQEQLAKTLFPLGDLIKKEVRSIAEKYGLPVYRKEESQDICFIPDNNYRGFLRNNLPGSFNKGPIVDLHGKRVGTHEGVAFYTIGQRKGLGLNYPEPVYVIDIMPFENTIKIGPREALFSNGLAVEDINFIASEIIEPMEVMVKIRYRSSSQQATFYPGKGNKGRLLFKVPQKAVTPGQAAVFYKGSQVIGGGTIEKSFSI